MAGDRDLTPTRQRKFNPKKPTTRKTKQVQPKPEEKVEDDEGPNECPEHLHLLRRFNEHMARSKTKTDKKKQVAFGFGSQVLRTFDKPRRVAGRSNTDSSPGTDDEAAEAFPTDVSGGLHKKKKCKEPWDYENSCYPITLPLRKPNLGDPDILDEAEFGKASTNLDYDENSIDAASELGLREKVQQQRMLFFQLPSDLPTFRRNAAMRETTNSAPRGGQKATDHGEVLNTDHNLELSKGFMGKMLVYKSGAVKLRLGEILYDVSPGSDCSFAQHVAAMNTSKKYFCEVGELDKRAVVTPDVDSLLESKDE